jgi:hypothetical protein
MSHTYYWEDDFYFEKEKPKGPEKKSFEIIHFISIDDDDDESIDVNESMDDDELSSNESSVDKCIQITIDDSDEELPTKKEEVLSNPNKRKFDEFISTDTPDSVNYYGLFNLLPQEVIDLIISYLLTRKHSDGKSAKNSFFPSWMSIFHTLKTFRNICRQFRAKITRDYKQHIIQSILGFKENKVLFQSILNKTLIVKTRKNIILHEILRWSRRYNKQQQDKENVEYLWLMFKTLVYLSSDFPTVTLKKRMNLSGEAGLTVYKPLKDGKRTSNEIINFYPNLVDLCNLSQYDLTKATVYKANFGPVNRNWKIRIDEEESFFKSAKTKFILSGGNIKNKDDMIDEIYQDFLHVTKINVF